MTSTRVADVKDFYNNLNLQKRTLEISVRNSEEKLNELLALQDIHAHATLTLKNVKPILSKESIEECEKLANSALSSVFGYDSYRVFYSVEDQKFMLDKGGYATELADDEGGGLVSLVSFVFQIFLIYKLGKRRFIGFDEQFTQFSDEFLANFIQFCRQLCKDLKFDILLISHDSRIDKDSCDHMYQLTDGKSYKIK